MDKNNESQDNNKHNEILDSLHQELANIELRCQNNNLSDISEKALKLLTMIKIYSTMKILKEDNKPVKIINGLYIGSIGAASNLEELNKENITHIVCAAVGIKHFYEDKFKYLQIDLLDSESQNIKQHFKESADFIHNAINSGGNVLVHCHAGISRSSTICISYLMQYLNMSYNAALGLMKSKREKINPNPGFERQLKEFEQQLLNNIK